MIVVTKDGLHDDFAQVLCVDEGDINKIVNNISLIHQDVFIMGLLDKRGDHALIVRLEIKNERDINKHIHCLLDKFTSVSWVRNGRLYSRRKR